MKVPMASKPVHARPVRNAPSASQAFAAALDAQLAQAKRWLADLHDPERGPLGAELSRAFLRAASAEIANERLAVNAAYNSFAWPPAPGRRGFRNAINYGPHVLGDAGRLFGARAHEHIHALQYRKAAALYADPFNDAAPFVLSPLAYVQRKERLEQDAYAKGAWLQSLLPVALQGALEKTPVSVEDFKALRRRHGNLDKTIAAAARAAARRKGRWLHNGSRHPARDLWHALALREYRSIMTARAARGVPLPVFVKMGAEDIAAIGDSLGSNPFRTDAKLGTALPKLSPENAKLLAELEQAYHVPQDLPTLGEALAAAKLSPATLICRSRRHRGA